MQAITIVVYFVLFILVIATVKTLIPNQKASKPCLLGYKAACSFAPFSTIILIAIAIGIFLITKDRIAT